MGTDTYIASVSIVSYIRIWMIFLKSLLSVDGKIEKMLYRFEWISCRVEKNDESKVTIT